MQKLNSKGFSAIEGLLLIVIIGVIGGAGYFVYNSQQKTKESLNATAKSQVTPQKNEKKTTPVAQADSKSYLVIKEWGVKIPLTDNVKGLSYKLTGNNLKQGDTATFRSDSLDAIGTQGCTSNSITVSRGTALQFVPQEAGESTTTYEKQYEMVNNDPKTYPPANYVNIKIGDHYYVTPNYRGASCLATNDPSLLKAEETAMTNIKEAINKMIAQ